MGPILYLNMGSRAVSTLVCRCMPAQAKSLLSTSTFALQDLPGAGVDVLLDLAREKTQAKTAFWPGQKDQRPLEKILRIPKDF
jgi:hypothetical protein